MLRLAWAERSIGRRPDRFRALGAKSPRRAESFDPCCHDHLRSIPEHSRTAGHQRRPPLPGRLEACFAGSEYHGPGRSIRASVFRGSCHWKRAKVGATITPWWWRGQVESEQWPAIMPCHSDQYRTCWFHLTAFQSSESVHSRYAAGISDTDLRDGIMEGQACGFARPEEDFGIHCRHRYWQQSNTRPELRRNPDAETTRCRLLENLLEAAPEELPVVLL